MSKQLNTKEISPEQRSRICEPVNLIEESEKVTKLTGVYRNYRTGPCPKCQGRDRFVVYSRKFLCRKCHPNYGDAIDYLCWLHDIDFVTAIDRLSPESLARNQERIDYQSPVRSHSFSPEIKKVRFPVVDSVGSPVMDKEKGKLKKAFIWYHFKADKWERGLNGTEPGLYNKESLPCLEDDDWVMFPEGLGSVDKFSELGFVSVTTPHGAGDQTGIEELAGLPVALFPDNDPEGLEHMESVARELYKLGSKIKIVSPRRGGWHKTPGEGVEDVIERESLTREQILNLVHGVELWTPEKADVPEVERRLVFSPDDIDEFWQRPAKRWIVNRFLGFAEVGVIAGDSEAGKTSIALNLSMALVKGNVRFADNFQVNGQYTVYYATGEGTQDFPARAKAAADSFGLTKEELRGRFLPYSKGDIIPQFFGDESAEYSIANFKADMTALGLKIDLLVVDTLAYSFGAGSITDNDNITTAITRAKRFAHETGTGVLFIHHNNRNHQFLGGINLKNHTDYMYSAIYDKRDNIRVLTCRREFTRIKDAKPWPDQRYEIDSSPLNGSAALSWLGDYEETIVETPPQREMIYQLLEESGPLGRKEISELTGIPAPSVSNTLTADDRFKLGSGKKWDIKRQESF